MAHDRPLCCVASFKYERLNKERIPEYQQHHVQNKQAPETDVACKTKYNVPLVGSHLENTGN